MSRKDYVAIAAVINQEVSIHRGSQRHVAVDSIYILASELADVFKADNDNFDRRRFLTACGLD